jgi:uncharacterized membrane protein YciS (DUF1049 family)
MGLYRSVDATVEFNMAFAYFSYSLPIIIATFFSSLLVVLGFMLLVLPGIYLSIAKRHVKRQRKAMPRLSQAPKGLG